LKAQCDLFLQSRSTSSLVQQKQMTSESCTPMFEKRWIFKPNWLNRGCTGLPLSSAMASKRFGSMSRTFFEIISRNREKFVG
jgi:hypothetical protein